jgi:phosphoglycolate phosphatase-like HAD superfamily hydrolase
MARDLLASRDDLLIDFDDTLVATYRIRSITLMRTARIFGFELAQSAIRASWGKPFPKLIGDLLPGVPYENFLSVYSGEMDKDVPVGLPGAHELLLHCQDTGKRVIVHSSSRSNLIEQDIDKLGWSAMIEAVFGVDKTAYAKPDPRSLAAPLAFLGGSVDPAAKTLYIGDSPSDSVAAIGAGVPFVCVLTGLTVEKSAFTPQTVFIRSLTELITRGTPECHPLPS